MAERLKSVGLDVGTTSTQLIVSELEIENKAGSFTVPEMEISRRKILYESPIYLTPLLHDQLVDARAIRHIVTAEYEKAGISRQQVDTGAVIITGETSRKENAAAVLQALSDFAGDFVVATAGPDLESVLAAKGAGAVEYSRVTGRRVLHMDIGGGTSNLAWIEDGNIRKTGCLNVGGRLIKVAEDGQITYISPVLGELCKLKIGQKADLDEVRAVAQVLVQALEMAAGLREPTQLLSRLTTEETGRTIQPQKIPDLVISFSGGVADCVERSHPPFAFGDIGPVLGKCIRESLLCRGQYRLGEQTIRATVIGAGCHSAQLSGSTVFYRDVAFPLKNRPVVTLSEEEQVLPSEELGKILRERLAGQDTAGVLALPGLQAPDYRSVQRLADGISRGFQSRPVYVAVEQDMAKALGQAIALRIAPGQACLCIDRVKLTQGSYLDVAAPVGPCLPVVVKTLIMSH